MREWQKQAIACLLRQNEVTLQSLSCLHFIFPQIPRKDTRELIYFHEKMLKEIQEKIDTVIYNPDKM